MKSILYFQITIHGHKIEQEVKIQHLFPFLIRTPAWKPSIPTELEPLGRLGANRSHPVITFLSYKRSTRGFPLQDFQWKPQQI